MEEPPHEPPTTVTIENWQDPDQVGWSFQHLDEITHTADIPRGRGPVAAMVNAPVDLTPVRVDLDDGSTMSIAQVVAATNTDGWMVLHHNRVIAEEYLGAFQPHTRHLLMSVSKSLVSTITGTLAHQGLIDTEADVADYLPELAGSGYAGATVRHLLDMRSGVAFSEDYLDPNSAVRLLDVAGGWAPPRPDTPTSLKAFLQTLRQERPHGGPFDYRSAETDVLGWLCEAASGRPFPALASEILWSRIGAAGDAFISVDREGTGLFDGGICATLADLARFGAMFLNRGRSLTGEQVVSAEWVDDVFRGGDDSAQAFAAGPDDHGMPGGRYRSNFWFPTPGRDLALCLGIHGQFVYIDREHNLVGVKLSSWPDPLDTWKHNATLSMFDAIGQHVEGA